MLRPLGDGLCVLWTEYPPCERTSRHAHQGAYFTIHVAGRFREAVAGVGERDFERWQSAFHPDGEAHAHETGPDGSVSVALIAHGPMIETLEAFGTIPAEPRWMKSLPAACISRRLVRELVLPDATSALGAHAAFMELAAETMRSGGPAETRAPGWLLRAREILHETLDAPVSLSDIGREVGIHPVHLAHEFKRFFGVPLATYHRRLRLERARKLLRSPDTTLAAVAAAAGFYDQAHFTKAFRQEYGVTPGRYRDESC